MLDGSFFLAAAAPLLDEPTAHVDASRVRTVEELVLRLRAERGTTVILASHDREQALRLAGRLVCLERGRLREDLGRIVAGRLARDRERLAVTTEKPGSDWPPSAVLVALELAGEAVLLRFDGGLVVRVPRDDVTQANPLPGERAELGDHRT